MLSSAVPEPAWTAAYPVCGRAFLLGASQLGYQMAKRLECLGMTAGLQLSYSQVLQLSC